MTKIKNTLTLEVELGEDFEQELTSAMRDELEIAERKWNTVLTPEDRSMILSHSRRQLAMKVLSIARPWELDNTTIEVSVPYPTTKHVKLPKDADSLEGMIFARPKNVWETTDTESDDSVDSHGFTAAIKNQLKDWARTAVFYGVGSKE